MKALSLTLCALLAACGGGGSSAPPAASHCTASATVLLLGDSTMLPTGPLLQTALDQRYGGRVTVTNHAVPGSSSRDLIDGSDGNGGLAQADGFTLVLMNHGINDLNMPLASYESRLQTIQAAIGDRLLMQTQNPVLEYGANGPKPWRVEVQPSYVEAMRRIADRVVDVNAYFLALPNWRALIADGTHPSDEGTRLIVEGAMVPAIESRLNVCEAS